MTNLLFMSVKSKQMIKGQSQIHATFLKMCVHMNFYLLFKIRDTNFNKKITKTCVFLVKQARNYISINFIASCKKL